MNRFAFALLVVSGFLALVVEGQHETALRQPLKRAASSSVPQGHETMTQGRTNAGSAQVTLSNTMQQPQRQMQQGQYVPGNTLDSSSSLQLTRSSVGQSIASPSSSIRSSESNRSSRMYTNDAVSSLTSSSASSLAQSQGQVEDQRNNGGLRGSEPQILTRQTNSGTSQAIPGETSQSGLSLPASRQRSDGFEQTMSRSNAVQVSTADPGGSRTSLEGRVASADLVESQSSMLTSTTTNESDPTIETLEHSMESQYDTNKDIVDESTFTTLDRGEVTEQFMQPMEMTSPQELPDQVIYPDHVPGYATLATTSQIVPVSSSIVPESQAEAPLPKHGKFNVEEDAAECKPLQPQEIPVSPTWLSSYPGSGSKMTWRLIESVTGLSTGDDLDSNGQVANGVAVAVKTHYPSHSTEDVFRQSKLEGISRAILVLRNPMHALPAYFRFVYYVEQKNERASKAEQPPEEAWRAWLNNNFKSEVKLWVDHVRWWMANFTRENLHLLPYEYLSSPERGSDELQKVGHFLASVDPVVASHLLEPEKFCCVWETMVDRAEITASRERKKAVYMEGHLEAFIQALIPLRDEFKTFQEFFILMQEYLGNIVTEKLVLVEARTKQA